MGKKMIDTLLEAGRKYGIYLLISFFAAGVFIAAYGTWTLNPCHVDWLLRGGIDVAQGYCGWMFYRKDPWLFPFGNFTSLSYPTPISIIYMDAVPLLAVVGKMFRSILPEAFQYTGVYQLFCFVMQGNFGVLLAKKYFKEGISQFLAGALAVLTPVFLWRVFLHVALSSHWILLMSLYSIVYYEEKFQGERKKKAVWWTLVGFLCTVVHAYYVPMCFIVLVGFLYLDFFRERKAWLDKILALAGFWVGVLASLYLWGGFIDDMHVADLEYQWRKTFNLNGFFNPQHWSRLLPELPVYHYGQSEGFAYLGLGVFFFILVSVVFVAWRVAAAKREGLWSGLVGKARDPKMQAYVLVFILSVIAAASPVVTLGERSIALPVPEKIQEIWIIFRCCGRLIWPAVYLIYFAVFKVMGQMGNKKVLYAVLTLGVLIQGVDISREIWERGGQPE